MKKNGFRQQPKQKKIGKKDRKVKDNVRVDEQQEDFDVQE